MDMKDAGIIRAEGGWAAFEPRALLGEGRTAEVYLVRDARAEREQVPLQLRIAAVTHQMPDTYALKIARERPGESLAARNERTAHEQQTLECLVHSEAFARCHTRDVVHRDLRPSNFTVEPDRGPVLFDFESSVSAFGEECSRVAVGAAEYAPSRDGEAASASAEPLLLSLLRACSADRERRRALSGRQRRCCTRGHRAGHGPRRKALRGENGPGAHRTTWTATPST